MDVKQEASKAVKVPEGMRGGSGAGFSMRESRERQIGIHPSEREAVAVKRHQAYQDIATPELLGMSASITLAR